MQKENKEKILVVEDSLVMRRWIVRTLQDTGYEVVQAADGMQALSQLINEQPDLMLLDLILPKLSGYKILSSIRKRERFQTLPVIILTSRDTLFDRLRGIASSSDGYLVKPCSKKELLNAIEEFLPVSRL